MKSAPLICIKELMTIKIEHSSQKEVLEFFPENQAFLLLYCELGQNVSNAKREVLLRTSMLCCKPKVPKEKQKLLMTTLTFNREPNGYTDN